MDLQIKEEVEEPTDHFILSTIENESTTGQKYFINGKIVSNGFTKNNKIKPEPINNDIDNSELDYEYLEEYSETEYTQETDQPHKSDGRKKGRARTSPAQISKLAHFMSNEGQHRNSEEAQRTLTDELNALGPPCRTSTQWRRTWSIIKYNNKRRRQPVEFPNKRSKHMQLDHHDDSTNSTSSKTHDANDDDSPNTKDHMHSQILQKMDLVLEQQTKQTNQLEKLNKNLEKLIGVLMTKEIS